MTTSFKPHRRTVLEAVLASSTLSALPAAATPSEPIHGTVAKGFEPVKAAFAQAQASDRGGAQLCVYHQGQRIVDLWTGRDPVKDKPFTADTVTTVFSCSKGVTASAAHLLVKRGKLDIDAPVSHYWPEFAANGKAAITVRQLLSHESGLSHFPAESGIRVEELLDWKRCVNALQGMAPLWPPGTAFQYHAITFGYLVGEVIRRAGGASVGSMVANEFRKPLGLRMWLGDLPLAEEANYAPDFNDRPPINVHGVEAALRGGGVDVNKPIVRDFLATLISVNGIGALFNTRAGHLAEVPAANVVTNARSLAKLYAALIGEIDGVRLLQPAQVNSARSLQTAGLEEPPPFDRIPVKHRLTFGLGYELPRSNVAMLGPGSFGHTGFGGRLGFANPDKWVAAAYVCNNMVWDSANSTDPRWSWCEALLPLV